MLKGFKEFLLRGNFLDLAVGVVIGAGFSGVVNSTVKDLITPLIAAVFKTSDFANLFFTINGSKFLYGDFINALISFVLVAAVVYFFVIIPMNALMARVKKEPPPNPSTKRCPECLSDIPLAAKRCAFCTQLLV
jgi:large conductance mechanosensitive channel